MAMVGMCLSIESTLKLRTKSQTTCFGNIVSHLIRDHILTDAADRGLRIVFGLEGWFLGFGDYLTNQNRLKLAAEFGDFLRLG